VADETRTDHPEPGIDHPEPTPKADETRIDTLGWRTKPGPTTLSRESTTLSREWRRRLPGMEAEAAGNGGGG